MISRTMNHPEQEEVRIALVGCGAIANAHARAVAAVSRARCTVMFDVDTARADALRDTYFPEAKVVDTLDQVGAHADAAIVAVPNIFHAPVTLALLRAGVHVLCEKPLATTEDAAQEMVAAAERRVLGCGLSRRFVASTALVSEALRRDVVGRPRHFEIRESVWNWPLNRGTFDKRSAGGGVLIDLGPHVLDLVAVWLGPVEILEYEDDSLGGVESTAWARIRCHGLHGPVDGEIFLTRAYQTPNYARIFCDDGYIEVNPHERTQIKIAFGQKPQDFITTAQSNASDPFARQLENFIAAINGEEQLVVTSADAVAVVRLIESCYSRRQSLKEPGSRGYVPASVDDPHHPYNKILVTGASGKVGSRLIEMWAERDGLSQLRCMVRSYGTASRVMRFPVEIVEADLTDSEAVRKAVQGCDAIIHLGVGARAERETTPLLAAARAFGVRRFVHMSTAAVYGIRMPQRIEEQQENTPPVKTGEPYADEKAAAERAAMRECARGLEGMILRPHVIYGPYMRWSGELMELLAEGRVPLIEDGGWCNLIYIDDLVESVRCALATKEGFGVPLFITDGKPLRWRDYIEAHAALMGATPPRRTRAEVARPKMGPLAWLRASVRPLLPVLRSDQFRAFVFESPAIQATIFRAYLALRDKQTLRPYVAGLRSTSDDAAPANGVGPAFHELWTTLQLSEARLSSARAEEVINFRASVDFSEGLRRSAAWFQRFGLIMDAEAASRQSNLVTP
jgi:predicted dehydrogenase/nucleoside-diphosphate-sugar epimerase